MKKIRTQSVDSVGSVGSDGSNKKGSKQAKTLIEKEEREKGAVNGQVYWAYVQAGGGVCRFAQATDPHPSKETMPTTTTVETSSDGKKVIVRRGTDITYDNCPTLSIYELRQELVRHSPLVSAFRYSPALQVVLLHSSLKPRQ